ncbi:hypothetical protein F8164_13695 [Bacillus cereus]|nr:hypothetical protein F8164_13695 [Bacillus cereus]
MGRAGFSNVLLGVITISSCAGSSGVYHANAFVGLKIIVVDKAIPIVIIPAAVFLAVVFLNICVTITKYSTFELSYFSNSFLPIYSIRTMLDIP